MSKSLSIMSHKGKYQVNFATSSFTSEHHDFNQEFFLIDERLIELYPTKFNEILESNRFIFINAKEENKSLNKFPSYLDQLVSRSFKRGQTLIAVGGGITQDITCFIASTIMRGVDWKFYPTTLLAQADSCIGSKSSINSGNIKNILGTFYPPKNIIIDIDFLHSLDKNDLLSGAGEIIKVHAIASPKEFDDLHKDYERLFNNQEILEQYILNSLNIKKTIIELDEFDTGPRNIMNYGHSFGHAIETATNFAIPHGIAVTIGMDLANYVSYKIKKSSLEQFQRMHVLLKKNFLPFSGYQIDHTEVINALDKDKKNTSNALRLILPDKQGILDVSLYKKKELIFGSIEEYFKNDF